MGQNQMARFFEVEITDTFIRTYNFIRYVKKTQDRYPYRKFVSLLLK